MLFSVLFRLRFWALCPKAAVEAIRGQIPSYMVRWDGTGGVEFIREGRSRGIWSCGSVSFDVSGFFSKHLEIPTFDVPIEQ